MHFDLSKAKNYEEASVFKPENLLRESRRQNNIAPGDIPPICLLDPDGDIQSYLQKTGQAVVNDRWACYHTTMYGFNYRELDMGIIGCAVGAPFAVLLAEQLFVSGCQLLISITSSGIITPPAQPVKFILINEAFRDEGTSYHYLPPEDKTTLAPELLRRLQSLSAQPELSIGIGSSWTTDAPYRETPTAIQYARSQGITAVEMEAAALYAFAKAKNQKVVCFAHLTNTMAQQEEDFEKGPENGSIAALELAYHTASRLI